MANWTAHAVRYASARTDRASSFLRYQEYGRPNEPITCDFYFWIVTSGDQVVLFDTGYSSGGGFRGLEWFCEVPAAVSALGASPADVSSIICSHLHSDHVGNLEHFPNAVIQLQRAEWQFWTGPMAERALFRNYKDDHQIDQLRRASSEGRVILLDGETVPAPGLRTVALPGHTPGQQGLRVTKGDQSIVLASDAVHYYDELDLDYPFFIVDHLPTMYAAFDTLRAMRASGDRLVAGHDSSDLDRYDRRPLAGGDRLTLL
jgi:glyoxylase-like metal-dependent hydrolase (beta-lactamase superfamily II)